MLKKLNLLLAGLCIVLATNSYADSRISLAGGVIGPNQSLALNLSGLPNDVMYRIRCSISSTANAATHFALGGAVPNYNSVFGLLNNSTIGSLIPGANGIVLKGQENTFEAPNMIRSSLFNKIPLNIIFSNLDNTAVETIHDCYADPAV